MQSSLKDNLVSLRDKYNKIYTLGPKGTFSNQAASLVGESKITDIKYTTTIPQIAIEILKSETALGVMPVENSISGMVGQAQDTLADSDIEILFELFLEIRFNLVSCIPLKDVKQFFSHTEAFNQTMLFTSKHMPDASVVFSNSNIHSGELFLSRLSEPVAAIIPKVVAEQKSEFRDKIAAENIQDYEHNMTRFVVIRKRPVNFKPDFTKYKTSICIEFKEDKHSLLFELLREFHVFGINLCRLESRPMKNNPWTYKFYIDLINNHRVEACFQELKNLDIGFKIFGSYDQLSQPA
ncbi:prephenate dehydratase [bacterium]|nr:prephenate dehydratase [bacterium]